MDIDGDDWLIGNQVLKVVNAVYQNDSSLWAVYFNNIFWEEKQPKLASEGGIPQTILDKGNYRTEDIWKTGHLRTFLRKLYMKIDEHDFIDEDGHFYQWKSDAFMHYSLVELAAQHIRKYDEFLYFYNKNFHKLNNVKMECRFIAKTQIPYLPLESLDALAQKRQGYTPP